MNKIKRLEGLLLVGVLICCVLGTVRLFADDVKIYNFSLGETTLNISSDCFVQIIRANGEPVCDPTVAFKLQYSDGKYTPGVQFIPSKDKTSFEVVYADGSKAFYQMQVGDGNVVFTLKSIESDKPIDECCLFNVSVPSQLGVATWINTVTLDDGLRVGVMTASINTRPCVSNSVAAKECREGCSQTFEKVDRQGKKITSLSKEKPVASFGAKSKRDSDDGWVVRGKTLDPSLDLTGCKKLRAYVCGDGKGEALKIQLGGEQGHRDDYISIDFVGWKVCELDSPALNDLTYDDVQRLYFYYNGLPANETVCCLIDKVEAIFDDGAEGERVVLLEDFASAEGAYWDSPDKILTAKTVKRHKLYPASCALVVASEEKWAKSVQQVQERANLPSPRLANGWRGESPYLHQSYFFLTWFNADEYENALRFAKRGGFKQILLLQNSWTTSTGHYEVNKNSFPGGVPQLREIIENFNKEGIRFGFHFLGASVDSNDPYMTPVPDKRFVTGYSTKLAESVDVDPETTCLKTIDDATKFPVDEDPYMGSGQVVRIDDELIEYRRHETDGLYDCQRGLYGTKVAKHEKGAQVVHFTRAYGYHLPDLDSDFIDEIASKFAKLANELPLDMIYFDGSELLQHPGEDDEHWYYNARLHKAFYDKLNNKNILFQASSCSPYSWNMIARNASADGHDDLKAYLEERSGGFDPDHTSRSYLDVGWYYAYDHNATPDMYEYCLGATVGYDASFSFQTSVDAAMSHPFIGEILDTIRTYEDLRLSGRITDNLREKFQFDPILAGYKTVQDRNALLDKRKEYHLETSADGSQLFRRVMYPIWQNAGSGESDLGGTTLTDATREGDRFTWYLKVDVPCRVGFQIHFKEEGETAEGLKIVDPEVSFTKIGDEKNVTTVTLPCELTRGQYAFALPGQKKTIYGAPLNEPKQIGDVDDVFLTPGSYRVSFTVASGVDAPIRVRTPLYTDETYKLPK